MQLSYKLSVLFFLLSLLSGCEGKMYMENSAEEIQEIFTEPSNLVNIELLNDDDEKFSGNGAIINTLDVSEAKTPT